MLASAKVGVGVDFSSECVLALASCPLSFSVLPADSLPSSDFSGACLTAPPGRTNAACMSEN